MDTITRRTALGAAIAIPAAAMVSRAAQAADPTEIDLFFPVPVQGMLANKMKELIERFNTQQSAIKATAVYTGSYDDTNLKTRAAIKAGKPPAAVIMSANFVREYVINGDVDPFDKLIEKGGKIAIGYFDAEFWPALKPNAVIDGKVYGIPYQNSTPLLYYSVNAFKDAGLDPEKPPATWAEWIDACRKLTKPGGERWGLNFPGTYDYCGWITSGLVMANGGQYFNHDYGGEVYYDAPSTLGALNLLDKIVNQLKAMPPGVSDANACTGAFFAGRLGMMILSTGSLSFVRDNMKSPYKVAFLPKSVRNAAPIGGASLILPKGNTPERQEAAWTLINWLTSPEIAGEWSRFTGYFAPRKAAYDLPEMKQYLAAHPDAKVALDQLQYAVPWFDTFNTVAVRKAMEDQVQAIFSAKISPADAAAAAQKTAVALLRPYVEQTALRPLG
ncbi:MAG TPA: ABC transporter substrate-binding protein [Stellaceae bacterium]|jgi:sn-glycerol 3-phosphate transport system substrate-binding protein|nr:ABC transporter substrate-binding protein [Stellaceae bacterium]